MPWELVFDGFNVACYCIAASFIGYCICRVFVNKFSQSQGGEVQVDDDSPETLGDILESISNLDIDMDAKPALISQAIDSWNGLESLRIKGEIEEKKADALVETTKESSSSSSAEVRLSQIEGEHSG